MFIFKKNAKIVFYSNPIPLSKGIEGLFAVVQNTLQMEFDSNTYFLFSNIKKNRFKVLYKNEGNLAIWFHRFEGTLTFRYSGEIIIFDRKSALNFLHKTRSSSRLRI